MLEEIAKQAATPAFWFGSVIVAVLVNFLSQWLYGRAGLLPGRFSQWFGGHSTRLRERMRAEVTVLRDSPHLIPLYAERAATFRGLAILGVVLAVALLTILGRLKTGPVVQHVAKVMDTAGFVMALAMLTVGGIAFLISHMHSIVLAAVYYDLIGKRLNAVQDDPERSLPQ